MSDPIVARSAAARLGVLCAAALAVALPARAEDIEVYEALVGARDKANILFVLDYSGSMIQDVAGGNANESGLPRRIDALRETIRRVLDDEEVAERVRIGVGPIYNGTVSGVRWPVSDLDVDGNTVDPSIPSGVGAREVIDSQLERIGVTGATRTVNALAEATMYFRGGPVTHGGTDPRRAPRHAPDAWNPGTGRYEGGNPFAAIAASYAPDGAYASGAGVPGGSGDYDLCYDYSSSGGVDGCAGRITYNCEVRAAGRWDSEADARRESVEHRRCRHEHPDRWQGATYRSPIEEHVANDDAMCRADNAIVLISDGIPDIAHDNDALRTAAGVPFADCEPLHESVFGVDADNPDANGNCGPEVTYRLATEDQVPGVASKVKTYTVGFALDGPGEDYLKLLADPGELFGDTRSPEEREDTYGKYFSADDANELAAALAAIFRDVGGDNESFAEISLDIDKASFSHDERAYFSLFRPSSARAWQGNLKGYFLDPEKGLVGIDGEPAVDDSGDVTHFADGAHSFWSDAPDGDELAAGGASGRLADDGRTLYTFTGDPSAISSGSVSLALSDANRLLASNASITNAHLGGASDAARRAALEWIQTAPMGDPLHSKSVSVRYAGTRERVVYVMTNQGLLHAIDATRPTAPGNSTDIPTEGGEEIFAYMPKRLLANLPTLSGIAGGSGGHVYGLDGAITRWHEDANNDGIVNGEDTLMLILGMRRGGEAYHAIDVTDPERPALKWVIDSDTPEFEALAQSWSRAALVRVRRGTGDERVLMFGGGYDVDALEPDGTPRDAPHPSRGNAVFVVDEGGRRVQTFTHPDMDHAIAADLTVIDSDGDGLADRLYAGDLGGQVWRVDFDDVDVAADTRVTRLARLDDGAHQPFFHAPSVAINRRARGDFLSVALGSGNRAAPLRESSANAFFMLRDTDVDKGFPTDGFETIEIGELYDATAGLIDSSDPSTANAAREALADSRGWRVDLERGEKSLSRLVSFDGTLFATTYAPPDAATAGQCTLVPTQRFYRMDIETASASAATSDGGETADTRSVPLSGLGIPSAPVIYFPEGSSTVQVIVDRRTVELREQLLTRVYWHAK